MGGTFDDLRGGESVAVGVFIASSDAAVETVVFTIVRYFDKSANLDFVSKDLSFDFKSCAHQHFSLRLVTLKQSFYFIFGDVPAKL